MHAADDGAPTLVAHRLTGYVPRIYRYRYEGEPPKWEPGTEMWNAPRTIHGQAASPYHV